MKDEPSILANVCDHLESSEKFSTIPNELTSLRRWIRWSYKAVNGKSTKIPLTIDGHPASTTDPNTWFTFDEVKRYGQIGFVFCKDDRIIGIDHDNVTLSPDRILQSANSIVKECDSYTEYSPSGTGLHTIGYGVKPIWLASRIDFGEAGLEIYDHGRYFTMTGKIFRDYSKMNEIDVDQVFEFLKPHVAKVSKRRPPGHSDLHISVHQVILGYKEGKNITHPFHDSTTGTNFRIDKGGETWRCWRHGVTGNALHLLGQREGIIGCGDTPSREQWKKIIAIAREKGLIQDRFKGLMEKIANARW